MVLEIRLVSILLFLICTSCNADSATDKAIVGQYTLILSEKDQACTLYIENKFEKRTFNLLPKSPCYFLRRESLEPQTVAYVDVGVLNTLIVIGSPISLEKQKKWNVDSSMACGEFAQGILIKKTGVEIANKTLEGGVFCRNQGSDEKNFWYLAH